MPSKRHQPEGGKPPHRPRWPVWRVVAGAVVAFGALLTIFLLPSRGESGTVAGAAPTVAATAARFFGRIDSSTGLAIPAERSTRLRELSENVTLTDHTLCSYQAATKYPVGSRPIAEQPDQVYPNQPVADTHDMRTEGGGNDPAIKLQTTQSRVFMAAGEAVAFSLRAIDGDGNVLALSVTRATAQGVVFKGGRATSQVALAFADDGKSADAVAGDGTYTAVLAPAQTGLAAFNGTIRSEVRYSVNGRHGVVLLDVIYSPELPATWNGPVRDAVENGSLVFYLKADVRMAGRYIVSGRVDDAKGRPFALATFNDKLAAGPAEVRLTVFGKLLRDQEPALPLTLRDVDGYLLKENTDPDRALLPRLEGKVATSKPHAAKDFSDAEWQGEERSRYLTEFGRDLNAARAALTSFDPTAPVPPSECGEHK